MRAAIATLVVAALVASCAGNHRRADQVPGAVASGQVAYIGEQRRMFDTGRADAAVSLRSLAGIPNLYAIGPVAGLDGEITVFDSRPHVSQVRGPGDAYIVDNSFDHDAIFLVWSQQRDWQPVGVVPESVGDYATLEGFIKETAASQGVDVAQPFVVLFEGTARRIDWHINIDRTDGAPVTRELFKKSKQPYVLNDEEVDIFGVYSEEHGGVFMSAALKAHLHFVSRDSAATGHIDAIDPRGLTMLVAR